MCATRGCLDANNDQLMEMEMLDVWMLGCQRRSADGDGDARHVDAGMPTTIS